MKLQNPPGPTLEGYNMCQRPPQKKRWRLQEHVGDIYAPLVMQKGPAGYVRYNLHTGGDNQTGKLGSCITEKDSNR